MYILQKHIPNSSMRHHHNSEKINELSNENGFKLFMISSDLSELVRQLQEKFYQSPSEINTIQKTVKEFRRPL